MNNVIFKLHPQPDQHTYQRDGLPETALGQRIEAERDALSLIKIKPLKLSSNRSASPNHIVIMTPHWQALQSYQTIVAVTNRANFEIQIPQIDLDIQYWDFSKTTSRYLHEFLELSREDLQLRIRNGLINFQRLNGKGHRVEKDGSTLYYTEKQKQMPRGGFHYVRA